MEQLGVDCDKWMWADCAEENVEGEREHENCREEHDDPQTKHVLFILHFLDKTFTTFFGVVRGRKASPESVRNEEKLEFRKGTWLSN